MGIELLLTILIYVLALVMMRIMKISRTAMLILLLALSLKVVYLSYTGYYDRNNDGPGQYEVIQLLLENGEYPEAKDCWQCYHPPIYYLLSTPFVSFSEVLNMAPERLLQFVSLIYSLFFDLIVFNIMKQIFKKKWQINLSALIALTWPSWIIHSVRLNNDVLVYLFIAAALYCLILFLKTKDIFYSFAAIFFSAFALLTKGNGAIILGLSLMILLIHLTRIAFRSKSLKPYLKALPAILITVIALLIYSYRIVISGAGDPLIANANLMPTNLETQNTASYLLGFDLDKFVNYPVADPWRDESGRLYFSNFFLKTSLFGSFDMSAIAPVEILRIISLLFLSLLPFLITGIIGSIKQQRTLSLLMLIILFAFVAGTFYTRLKYPYISSYDFRYALPIIIPYAYFLTFSLSKGKMFQLLGLLLTLFFSLFSSLMILWPYLKSG